MERYVALLRGVNIRGRNKIAMWELKEAFSRRGYSDVLSYLNSGNIIFSCEEKDEILIVDNIREMIMEQFELDISVFVILQNELQALLEKHPNWWGTEDKEIYDNLIFVIPPSTAEETAEKIGEPTADLEQISICDNAIFWSFDRNKYSKSNWWKKTASAGIGEALTIRTANTLRKIAQM